MSTPYQICNSPSTSEIDVESTNRFYMKRNIEGWPQYDSNFNIFMQSMFSRLKGMAIISIIYVAVCIVYFEQVINESIIVRPTVIRMEHLAHEVTRSNNVTLIRIQLEQLDKMAHNVEDSSKSIYQAFGIIDILCYFNLMFFITQIIQLIFLRKLDRTFPFPTISFFTDLTLFVVSIFSINWMRVNIFHNVEVEGIPEA